MTDFSRTGDPSAPPEGASAAGNPLAAVFRPKAVERFTSPEDLDDLMVVTRPHSWLLLLAAALVIGAAGAWAVFGSVAATASGVGLLTEIPAPTSDGEKAASDSLGAVVWVPIAEAHRLEPGMEVHLSPRGFPPARFGYLEGICRDVERVPRPVAGDFDLEAQPWLESLQTGTFVRVVVSLRVPGSSGQPRWTSGHGSPIHLVPGLNVDATFFLGSEQPLPHLIPWSVRSRG